MRITGYLNVQLGVVVKDVARFYTVLADEARLQMLWLLFNHGELCVCDFVDVLAITQSKASRHLATLRHAGLVSDRRAGAWTHYSIRPPANRFEQSQLDALRAGLADHPGAARLLQDLHSILKRSGRNACHANDSDRAGGSDGG